MDLNGKKARVLSRGPLSALAAVAVTGTIAGLAASASAHVATPARVRPAVSHYTVNVGYIGNSGHLTGPEGFAYSTGQLQKSLAADGVTIKLSEFANGPLLTAAVTGGSVDLGIVGDTPALIAKSHGLPVRMINQGEINLPAWIVSKKGGPTTIAGLKGATIAVPEGSFMYRYLEGIIAEHGLTGKVTLTNMLPPEAIAAAESGSVAAVALPAWEVAPIIAAGGKVIAKSETTPSIQGTEVTIATNSVLSKHPDIAKYWDAARLKAVAYANAHPAQFYANEAVSEGIKAGAAAAKSFLPLSDFPHANYTPAGLKTLKGTLSFLVSQKQASTFSLTGWEAPGT